MDARKRARCGAFGDFEILSVAIADATVAFWAIAFAATSGCSISPKDRPVPLVATYPTFGASARCPNITDAALLDSICGLIEPDSTSRLEAPPGARVYRAIWESPFTEPSRQGQAVLTVYSDGRRVLETPWRRRPYVLRATELPDFEASVARSDFSEKPAFNGDRLDCFDAFNQSLEVIVDGVCRVAYFHNCNFGPTESVLGTIDRLRDFAARVSGRREPAH